MRTTFSKSTGPRHILKSRNSFVAVVSAGDVKGKFSLSLPASLTLTEREREAEAEENS